VAGVRKQPNAIIKEIQYNPVKNEYFHIDFQEIAMNEKMTTSLSITVVGDAPGVKTGGGVLEHHLWEIEAEGIPANMPDHIEVDVSGLEIGDNLHVSDIVVPEGVEIISDPSLVILAISAPRTEKVETGAVEGIAPEAAAGSGAEAASAAE
jgi:large subunit ribosomal protein L25